MPKVAPSPVLFLIPSSSNTLGALFLEDKFVFMCYSSMNRSFHLRLRGRSYSKAYLVDVKAESLPQLVYETLDRCLVSAKGEMVETTMSKIIEHLQKL